MSPRGGKREGAGRPKEVDTVDFHVRVTPETKTKIAKKAEDQGKSMGQIVDERFKDV